MREAISFQPSRVDPSLALPLGAPCGQEPLVPRHRAFAHPCPAGASAVEAARRRPPPKPSSTVRGGQPSRRRSARCPPARSRRPAPQSPPWMRPRRRSASTRHAPRAGGLRPSWRRSCRPARDVSRTEAGWGCRAAGCWVAGRRGWREAPEGSTCL
eukprot:scaffold2131_cov113-Isochrysis_galbana.AAC.13